MATLTSKLRSSRPPASTRFSFRQAVPRDRLPFLLPVENFMRLLLNAINQLTLYIAIGVLFMAAYTTYQVHELSRIQDFQSRTSRAQEQVELLASVARAECDRSDRLEANFDALTRQYVEQNARMRYFLGQLNGANQALSILGNHIEDCHRLMKENQVPVPAMRVDVGETEPPAESQAEEMPENLEI